MDSDLFAIEYGLRDCIRQQELLKLLLPAQTTNLKNDHGAVKETRTADTLRVLAIITNVDYSEEEGCIFVFRKVDDDPSNEQFGFELLSLFPLTNALKLSVAQGRSRSDTIDLRPGKYVPPTPQNFTLTLETDEDKQTFIVESSDLMRDFIEDSRRLIKIANTASSLDFRWVGYYRPSRQLEIPLLFPKPDVRHLQKLPHEELSHAYAGDSGESEPGDSYIIRDHWMRSRMSQDKNVFLNERRINIRLCTFNVNGKPPSQDLSQWIRPQHKTTSLPELPPLKDISPISLSSFAPSNYLNAQSYEEMAKTNEKVEDREPDLLVVGFQELDLSTEALIYSYTTTKEEQWLSSIFAGLGEVREQYVKIASKQLVGMLIICIAKKELVDSISDIRTCSVGAGFMGMMGNKGASAIRLTLGSIVISFINAHLAAFDEYADKRNADFHDLSRRLLLQTIPVDDEEPQEIDTKEENVFQSDVVFWMGDLNYRIDLPDPEVRQMIAGEPDLNVRDLLAFDQLTSSRFKRKAFEDFKEGEIKHLPTYRFSIGVQVAADQLGYDLKRRPAYTDRILYLASPSVDIRQKTYTSHPEITMSDHRPVSANFDVTICSVNVSGYYRRARDLACRLGHFEESEEIPRLNISASQISFGDVRHNQKETRSLVVENTGNLPCAFRLVALNETDSILPDWLTVTPQMGILLPGETESLSVTVLVNDASATRLNIGDAQLRHTIILHSLRGKDSFISISGNYLPTCFANELETLVRLPGSIRQFGTQSVPLLSEMKPKTNAPREVIRLINWLMSNAAEEHELFLVQGDTKIMNDIREALDTGDEFDFSDDDGEDNSASLSHSFASVLIGLIQSLPTSLVPHSLHDRCARVADRDEAFELLTALLPSSVLNVWISLTAFLHYIGQRISDDESERTRRAEQLACIFAPLVLRDRDVVANEGSFRMTPIAKRRFLLHFIK